LITFMFQVRVTSLASLFYSEMWKILKMS